jgi:hypothetical protein
MAWTKGFNFRSTSGYVTDTGDNTYVLGSTGSAYPTTQNGVTFGWGNGGASTDRRDRNSSVDQRFAGSNFQNVPYSYAYFRVDLPATGEYVIRLSMGDYSYSQAVQFAILDDSSVLTAPSGVATGSSNRYVDATGVVRTSPSDWISNNASYTGTFTTQIFMLRTGDGGSNTYGGSVTHLWIDQVAVVGGVPKTTKLAMLGVG